VEVQCDQLKNFNPFEKRSSFFCPNSNDPGCTPGCFFQPVVARGNPCSLQFAEDAASSRATNSGDSDQRQIPSSAALGSGVNAMSDLLIQWEAKLIELVGELHSCERRRREIESVHGHNADAAEECRCSAVIRKKVANLMDLFPDVELSHSILDDIPHWRYEEISIEQINTIFGAKYRVRINGVIMKTSRSLRKAKKELKQLLRKRIVAQVEEIMT
jgi:hypothetical protein